MKNNDVLKRVLAIFTIVLLACCIIVTLVFAFTGNKNFMGMLMITLLMPILMWIIMFFYKQMKDRSNET